MFHFTIYCSGAHTFEACNNGSLGLSIYFPHLRLVFVCLFVCKSRGIFYRFISKGNLTSVGKLKKTKKNGRHLANLPKMLKCETDLKGTILVLLFNLIPSTKILKKRNEHDSNVTKIEQKIKRAEVQPQGMCKRPFIKRSYTDMQI